MKHKIAKNISDLQEKYRKYGYPCDEQIVICAIKSIVTDYEYLPNEFELDLDYKLQSTNSILNVLIDLGISHVRSIRLLSSYTVSIVIT